MNYRFLLILSLIQFLNFSVCGVTEDEKENVLKETVTIVNSVSNRMKNRLGFYAALQSDPAPSRLGINLAYNLSDISRFHMGFGLINEPHRDTTLFGWGFNLFVPEWSTSPTIGVSYAGVISPGTYNGVKDHLYLNMGLDCQLDNGFYVGVGFNHSITESTLRTLPFVHLGHFFKP